jgi:concentrative nucleoside transporter, CNT family
LKKRFYLIILLAISLLPSCRQKLGTADLITTTWSYVSIKDTSGRVVKKAGPEDTLKILKVKGANGITLQEFSYRLGQEKIEASGEWRLEGNDLYLTYDLKPSQRGVDSSAYIVDDSTRNASVVHFGNGKEVARITTEGLADQRQVRKFHITKIDANNLVLEENGVVFTFTHTSSVQEGSVNLMSVLRGILGVTFLIGLLYLLSSNRRAISWKLVLSGLAFQLLFAIGVLKVPFVQHIFEAISGFFVVVISFTQEGTNFLFKSFITDRIESPLVNFVIMVLPTIIFFSALTSLFFYLGILQKIVYGFAWVMSRFMKMSGAESLSAAANIFLGQTEAPLMIKPYIGSMTRSEILTLMVGGMATIAGGVLAAYIGFLGGDDPVQRLFFAKHLLAASVMSAPAAVICAKMLLPQTEPINEKMEISKERIGSNVLDAIANGTIDGLKLAANVAAMLLVFTALIAMLNYIMQDVIGDWTGLNDWVVSVSDGRYKGLSLQFLLGYICAPVAWMMGVNSEDMVLVGQLLGEKTILNEFFAYKTLGQMQFAGDFTDRKSIIIATYILCGFSNFASIGIQIGGIGSLAPGKRPVLSSLGIKALIGGTIASLFTATIVGMLI